jgi:hypothetical protein
VCRGIKCSTFLCSQLFAYIASSYYEHVSYLFIIISFYFRYQLFFLQSSSLRRNPFISIAYGSRKKVTSKRQTSMAVCLQISNYLHCSPHPEQQGSGLLKTMFKQVGLKPRKHFYFRGKCIGIEINGKLHKPIIYALEKI